MEQLNISFSNCELSIKLFDSVDPLSVTFRATPVKVELKLKKLTPGKWLALVTEVDRSPVLDDPVTVQPQIETKLSRSNSFGLNLPLTDKLLPFKFKGPFLLDRIDDSANI